MVFGGTLFLICAVKEGMFLDSSFSGLVGFGGAFLDVFGFVGVGSTVSSFPGFECFF